MQTLTTSVPVPRLERRAAGAGVRWSAAAHAVAASLAVVALAERGGGGYDLVPRQQAAVLVWCAIGGGYAFGLLPRGRPPRALVAACALALALAGWTALALTWTSSAERTAGELARTLLYAGVLILIASVSRHRSWRPILAGLLAGAVVVTALMLGSRLDPAPYPVPLTGGAAQRLSYPFGYWNASGAWAAVTFAALLGVSAGLRAPALRVAALACAPVCLAVVYLTYSRGALAGVAFASLVAFAFARTRVVLALHATAALAGGALVVLAIRSTAPVELGTGGGDVLAALGGAALGCALVAGLTAVSGADDRLRVPRRAAQALLIAAAALALAAAAIAGPSLARDGWRSFQDSSKVTRTHSADPLARVRGLNGQRVVLYGSALRAFEAEPLHGIGPGTFELWWNRDRRYDGFVRNAHSLYLETLAELGLPGLALLLGLLGALAVGAIQATRLGGRGGRALAVGALSAFAVYAALAGVDWFWQVPALTLLPLAAAATVAMRGTHRARRRPRSLRIGLPLLAIVCVAVELPQLAATRAERASAAAAARGDLAAALRDADRSVERAPWDSSGQLQRALVLEARGELPAAVAAATVAAQHASLDWRPQIVLARLQAERGRPKTALRAYRRALALKPALANGVPR